MPALLDKQFLPLVALVSPQMAMHWPEQAAVDDFADTVWSQSWANDADGPGMQVFLAAAGWTSELLDERWHVIAALGKWFRMLGYGWDEANRARLVLEVAERWESLSDEEKTRGDDDLARQGCDSAVIEKWLPVAVERARQVLTGAVEDEEE